MTDQDVEQVESRIMAKMKNDPDPMRLNGKRQILLWGSGISMTGMIGSILSFWLGFYPQIATLEFVEKKVASKIAVAPITGEAKLRLQLLEASFIEQKEKVSVLEQKVLRLLVLEDLRSYKTTMP